jgi:putative hemolysin
MKKFTTIFIALFLMIISTGCSVQNPFMNQSTENEAADSQEVINTAPPEDESALDFSQMNEVSMIANPASENCVGQGGTLEIRQTAEGEYGVCIFSENKHCEEWALLMNECPVGGVDVTDLDPKSTTYECVIKGGKRSTSPTGEVSCTLPSPSPAQ